MPVGALVRLLAYLVDAVIIAIVIYLVALVLRALLGPTIRITEFEGAPLVRVAERLLQSLERLDALVAADPKNLAVCSEDFTIAVVCTFLYSVPPARTSSIRARSASRMAGSAPESSIWPSAQAALSRVSGLSSLSSRKSPGGAFAPFSSS